MMESSASTKIGSIILKNVVCRNVQVQRNPRGEVSRYRAFFSFDATSGIVGRLLSSINEMFPDLSLVAFLAHDQIMYSELTIAARTCVIVPPNVLPLHEVEDSSTSPTYYSIRDTMKYEPVFSASVNVLVGGITICKSSDKHELAHTVSFSYIRVLYGSDCKPWVCTGTYTTQLQNDVTHISNMCRLNNIRAEIESSRGNDPIVIRAAKPP